MFVVSVYLYCDGNFQGCDCQTFDSHGEREEHGFAEASSGDSQFTTKKDYRELMKTQGWAFRGTKAYCPVCKSKLDVERIK